MSDVVSTVSDASVELDEALAPSSVEASSLTDAPQRGETLEVIIERIRARVANTTKHIMEIGSDLKLVKDRVSRGEFGNWLERHFGWSESTAQRYMRAFEVWGDKAELVSALEASAIYLLTAKATPPQVRTEVETLLNEGKPPSLSRIREMVKEARAAVAAEKDTPKPHLKAHAAAALILGYAGERGTALRECLSGADAAELLRALRDGLDEGVKARAAVCNLDQDTADEGQDEPGTGSDLSLSSDADVGGIAMEAAHVEHSGHSQAG